MQSDKLVADDSTKHISSTMRSWCFLPTTAHVPASRLLSFPETCKGIALIMLNRFKSTPCTSCPMPPPRRLFNEYFYNLCLYSPTHDLKYTFALIFPFEKFLRLCLQYVCHLLTFPSLTFLSLSVCYVIDTHLSAKLVCEELSQAVPYFIA